MQLGIMENGTVRFLETEPAFSASYDTIVIGLGTAGAEAALTAASFGLRTLGIEQQTAMGGQSTLGGVHFQAKRPPNRKFIPSEVLNNHHPDSGSGRLDIPAWSSLMEQEADEAGLDLSYETIITGVYRNGNTVTGVRICRNGHSRDIAAKVVMDCTGNCTVSRMAGCQIQIGRDFDHGQAAISKVYVFQTPSGYRPSYGFFRENPSGSAMDYSSAVLGTAAYTLGMYRYRNRSRVLMAASILGAREEGHVVTERTVSLHDCLFAPPAEHPLFHTYTPLDLCLVDEDWAFENRDVQNWKVLCGLHNFAYPSSLPYETLLPAGIGGLLVPSKHFGVTHAAGSGIRMIGEMRKTGYAAACAAKLAVESDLPLNRIPYDRLRPLLDKGGITKPAKRKTVNFCWGGTIRRPSLDEAVDALKHDIVPAGSWIHKPKTGIGEKAAFAFFTFWEQSERLPAARKKQLTDRLFREMQSAGRYTGNFAIALGLMDDPRCNDILRNIVEHPGESNPNGWDPLIRGAYPNRIKALCLLGRLGGQDSIPVIRDIVFDYADSFTEDLTIPPAERGKAMTGYQMFNGSKEQYQFAALSFALFSLTDLLKRYPDSSLSDALRAWNRKPFRLIAGKRNFDCAPMLRQIIAKRLP